MKNNLLNINLLICITVSVMVLNYGCKSTSDNKEVITNKVFYTPEQFVMGVDLSYVNQLEDYGATFTDSGKVKDAYTICRQYGANLVRVRLWHTPKWTADLNKGKYYSDLADVAETIRRSKALGMQVNLDLHYSDNWADPNKQPIPAAWEKLPYNVLCDSLYAYTLYVLRYYEKQNLTPEMIQIGNENNFGMLYPIGQTTVSGWEAFAGLLRSGIKAVRDFSATSAVKPKIILHVAQLQYADAWADSLMNRCKVTDFDILGLSHYYQWSTVNKMADMGATIKNLKTKYGKPIMVVETAFSWTTQNGDNYNNIMSDQSKVSEYVMTPEGQQAYMTDFTQQIISNGGSGIMYWEPAWITSSLPDQWGVGSSWDNNTLFDFKGNTLPAINFMNTVYKGITVK